MCRIAAFLYLAECLPFRVQAVAKIWAVGIIVFITLITYYSFLDNNDFPNLKILNA